MTDVAAPADLAAAYDAYAAEKEERVRALLREHGLPELFAGLVRCPVEQGYRVHASFTLEPGGDGEAGFLGVDPRGGGRAPLEETLWVLPEHARPIVRAAAAVLLDQPADSPVTGFDLRLEYGSPRAHLTLDARRDSEDDLAPLAGRLRDEVPDLLGVAIPSRGVELGETHLRHALGGRTLLSHHLAFFQTNLRLTPELVAEVQRGVDDPARIADLYCGVGLHSVLAAREGSEVAGADTNRWAIESAQRNAELHGIAARFERRPVEAFLRHRPASPPSIAFVNPSRYGCAPGIPEAVAAWRPARACLVSCSIDAHLRDTLAFARAGYEPESLRCFDMFPFTPFLESVTHFVRAA